MRDFSAKAPEVMEFTLGGGEHVYSLPLAASMPLDVLRKISRAANVENDEQRAAASIDAELEIIARYLGEDVAQTLTGEQVNEIFAAWAEESEKAGASTGE